MTIAAFFLSHWWHYFYVPTSGPWYGGNVWGNVFVIAVVAPLGYIWSKTKFWPLRPIGHALRGLHVKADLLAAQHEQLHSKVEQLHARHAQHAEHLDRLGRSLIELHEKIDDLGDSPPADR